MRLVTLPRGYRESLPRPSCLFADKPRGHSKKYPRSVSHKPRDLAGVLRTRLISKRVFMDDLELFFPRMLP
ncbi:unnamed protein product [Didymodactylos carnosus]|uniref:Uncharacterized protein n=1 Tax=Didymodactylos carnosus TaxID=1234261 RepID=A0A815CJ36_9BILA|nr:unnamed protein product [Didymodactylos carnosus]CAF1360301.1 unnamed protein product [Didymodactylos carnosus]CAF4082755.1 unnamed protein product [Didymodactylos carnosus]CAF4170442.1 unnamed protein product [Didymodactylos carnosus]